MALQASRPQLQAVLSPLYLVGTMNFGLSSQRPGFALTQDLLLHSHQGGKVGHPLEWLEELRAAGPEGIFRLEKEDFSDIFRPKVSAY